jgi:hypothetical protein
MAGTAPISTDGFPYLTQFLGGYFHEDWDLDHTSSVEAFEQTIEPGEPLYRRVVAAYAAQCSPQDLVATADELERLIDMPLSDEELHFAMAQVFYANYWPGHESGYRPWLRAVRGQLLARAQGVR